MRRRNFGAEALTNFALEEAFQFEGRTGEQNDDVLASVELAADPLAGRSAIGIRKNGGAIENIGLFGVVGGHLPSALGKSLLQAGENFGIAVERNSEGFGDGFASEIVFGGAEASAEDQDVGAK